MGEDCDRELFVDHRCDARCEQPVRCIICNRLKRPVGVVVPSELTGMRCEDRCPGYLLDPVPGHRWPAFVPHEVAVPAQQLVGSTVGGRDAVTVVIPPASVPGLGMGDGVELLAWALHQAHPPTRRRHAVRAPVTYRIACLLIGDDAGEVVSRLVRAGCAVRQLCQALGSVVLEVSGDPVSIIEVLDAWDGTGSIEIVPPPPAP